MTESELVKEYIRYWKTIEQGASALPTYLLWARSEGAPKKAARELWKTMDAELRYTIRVLLEG